MPNRKTHFKIPEGGNDGITYLDSMSNNKFIIKVSDDPDSDAGKNQTPYSFMSPNRAKANSFLSKGDTLNNSGKKSAADLNMSKSPARKSPFLGHDTTSLGQQSSKSNFGKHTSFTAKLQSVESESKATTVVVSS